MSSWRQKLLANDPTVSVVILLHLTKACIRQMKLLGTEPPQPAASLRIAPRMLRAGKHFSSESASAPIRPRRQPIRTECSREFRCRGSHSQRGTGPDGILGARRVSPDGSDRKSTRLNSSHSQIAYSLL